MAKRKTDAGARPASVPENSTPLDPTDARATRRIKGRTIYLHDDLFERIIVQAHRRNRTISEYVTAILERQVPDHRVVRADPVDAGAA